MQIIDRQISGLGNQLFQYAAGRYFGTRYNSPVTMAIDPPEKANSYGFARPFLLSHFNISVPVRPLSRTDRLFISTRRDLAPLRHAFRRARHVQVFAEPRDQQFTFIRDIALEPGIRTLYLSGYWQNYGMVQSVEEILRRELTFKAPAEGKNRELLAQIAFANQPVSLHVRRGDYTLAAEGNRVLSMDFYARAVALLRDRVADPTFFIFSDDIPFTRANLPAGLRAVFVDHNDDASSHEDLRLMSACRHHIIANSSFSWWGAWLNPNPGKIVVAPQHWILSPASFYPDLLPPEWLLLDSLRAPG